MSISFCAMRDGLASKHSTFCRREFPISNVKCLDLTPLCSSKRKPRKRRTEWTDETLFFLLSSVQKHNRELDSSRASNRSLRRMDSTKRKSRGAPNSLATSRMSGAFMNRATTKTIPNRSCAASTAFSYSMTESVGGSSTFTGNKKVPVIPFRRNI